MSSNLNSTIISYLSKYRPERIGIFGSFARGDNNSESDLDLLVTFRQTLSLLDLVRIERELSELLGIKVDLLTEGALKNQKLRSYIMRDIQIIYEW